MATGVFRVATECGCGPTKGSESPLATEGSDVAVGFYLDACIQGKSYGHSSKDNVSNRRKGFSLFFLKYTRPGFCDFSVSFEIHPTLRYTETGCRKAGNSGFSGLEGQIDLVGAIVEENSYLRNLTLGFVSIFHKGLHRVATTPFLTLDSSPGRRGGRR